MGNPVHLLESRADSASAEGSSFELRARLEGGPEAQMPVLFLLSSLAFLEAQPAGDSASEYFAEDGWTPADFVEHLRFDGGGLGLDLGIIRGRSVLTRLSLTPNGDLQIATSGRGQSPARWLSFVRGRSHIQPVS